MASSLHNLLSTLVFLSIIFHYPTTTTPQECPYPCYPPPTGPGNNPPVTTSPPLSTTPPASFSPPISTTPPASFSPPISTAPPAGYFPFTPPPPYFYGATPPPPDPIVPWFPFYYRKPPHQDQNSAPTAIGGSRTIIFIFPLFIVFTFVFH